MVGSFYILAMLAVLRLIAGTLTDKFRWITKVIPFIRYSIYVMLAVFVIFTVIQIINAVAGGGRKR